MNAQDLYIRLEDPAGKHSPIVSHHRVWDRNRFLASLRNTHEVKAEEGDKRNVSVATEAEYRKFKGYKECAA